MNKKIAIFLLGVLTMTQLSGCAVTDFFSKPEKIARFSDKIARAQTLDIAPKQEIEVFDLSKDTPTLTFTKSTVAQSQETAYVIPQTSGKVTGIKVKVGDKVKKGTLLFTLGDSLATDIGEIQYQTALKTLDLTRDSGVLTNDSAKQTVQVAALGVKTSYEALQNAKKAKEHANDIYEEQKQGARYGRDSAVDAKAFTASSLDKLEQGIQALEEQISTLSDTLSTLSPSDPNYDKLSENLGKLQEALAAAEGQKATLEFNKENAARGIDQAENGMDLLEESFKLQQDQLTFAIVAATNQYDMALKQFTLSLNGTSMQRLGIDSQILQMDSAVQMAKLSSDQKNIKSPISGFVTDISATENNLVAPGMPIAKIENPEKLSLKTSLNSDEAPFVTTGEKVKIRYGSTEIPGTVTAVSPSFSDTSKKINIEVEAENPNNIIIPGALVKIIFSTKPTNRIFIPLNSLRNNDTQQFVTVIKNKKVSFKNVEIGDIIGDYIEILGGLKGNETILKTADNYINEGDQL
ncbi:MAG: efflux RND transporter periplasmic adaptor subunit [Candidatus Gracilibacteria bacterium]|jgi:RND family efflux transporter MFP subunit